MTTHGNETYPVTMPGGETRRVTIPPRPEDEDTITLSRRDVMVAGQALNFALAELRGLPEEDTRALKALVRRFERFVNGDEEGRQPLP